MIVRYAAKYDEFNINSKGYVIYPSVYSDVKKLKEISYNEEKDAAHLEGHGDVLTLEKGDFMITFTQDAHMPCICKENPVNLGKMIAKIKA